MLDSVRLRLTLWHVGLLALLLIAFSAGSYSLMRRHFYERADGILMSVASATISILREELSESGIDELASRKAVRTLNFPEHTLAIFDADGDLLIEKPVGSSQQAPLPARDLLKDGVVLLYTTSPAGANREQRRVAALRVALEPVGRAYTVVTSRSLTTFPGELATDRLILIIAVPLGLLLAGCAGWFLARKSLAPVLAMSEKAYRIGVENLDQRLPVVNPRDELGRLAATFNRLLERLSSAFAQQRQFMADASHELRTPLSVIRTAASVSLERDQRTEEQYRKTLAIIDEQGSRVARIVDDMFQLARADVGRMAMHKQPLYLDELLSETIRAASLRELSASLHDSSQP